MSAIPGTVTIGHLDYLVVVDDALVNEHSVRKGGSFSGYSNSAEQIIALATKAGTGAPLGDGYRREVLLHEVIHQCLRVTGTDPDRDAKAGVEDVEERAVEAISGPLLAVLRSNPGLLEYLLA